MYKKHDCVGKNKHKYSKTKTNVKFELLGLET